MKKWIAVLSFLFVSQPLFPQARPAKNIKQIDSLLQRVYSDSLPGISIGILQNGSVLFTHGYGVKNINSKERITPATNFNIASLTKQFTALAILQLAEQNKLSLRDKLSRFFPAMNRRIADSINVQQLLSHTSGVYDHYNYVDTKGLQHGHDKDVYKAIANLDSLYFTPGTKFRYSNTAYCLLALVVEKVSGLSYHEYLKRYIFHPAGMEKTRVWNETVAIPDEATGYDRDSTSGQLIPS